MSVRQINKSYADPLDLIWMNCAESLKMEIDRDDEVNVSWDGSGILRIGDHSLDSDDCLAQLVLHEICHWIVEGPQSYNQEDWGLNDHPAKSRKHEFAALRLQAALADKISMRDFFSATTDFFEYYRALPDEPLLAPIQIAPFELLRPVSKDEDDWAIQQANSALQRLEASDARAPVFQALESTRKIFEIVNPIVAGNSLWS